jgi:hypothetical protein
MGLMRALGAAKIEVRAEFSEESKVATHAVLDTAARTVNANGKRTQTESGRIESTFECDGSDTPHLPEHLVWLEVEPTWREVVAGRLSRDQPHPKLYRAHSPRSGIRVLPSSQALRASRRSASAARRAELCSVSGG